MVEEVVGAHTAAEWALKQFSNGAHETVISMLPKYPDDIEVLFYGALSLECTSRTKEAIEILEKIIAKNPKHHDALRTLVWHYEDNDYKQLIALELMAKADLADGDDMCRMAEIYLSKARFSVAHYWFQRCLEKEPKNSLALLGIAQLHAKLAIVYLRETENTLDIDLSEQMSDDRETEEMLRFAYESFIAQELPELVFNMDAMNNPDADIPY